MGSSAEHGSSNRMTSGVHGERARDAQALLLAARERERAFDCSLSLTSSHSAAPRRLSSTSGVEVVLAAQAVALGREHDVLVDGLVERVGLLEHHAYGTAQLVEVLLARVDVAPAVEYSPSTRQPRISRFMRFRLRKKVDLPQPEGPMSAVISPLWNASEVLCGACVITVEHVDVAHLEHDLGGWSHRSSDTTQLTCG